MKDGRRARPTGIEDTTVAIVSMILIAGAGLAPGRLIKNLPA